MTLARQWRDALPGMFTLASLLGLATGLSLLAAGMEAATGSPPGGPLPVASDFAAGSGNENGPMFYLPLVVNDGRRGVIQGTIEHGGMLREYILYVPSSYSDQTPAPLILNYHAYSRDAQTQMEYGDFRPVSERTGAIIVHPQGAELNGVRRWNVGGLYTHPQADDVGFTAALLNEISEFYSIDTTRIYSTGFSNGAYMSYLVACQLSDRVAAVAPVAGSMTPEMADDCTPGRPLAVLHIHGLEDLIVPFNGDPNSIPVAAVLDYWIANNGNGTTPLIEALPDLNPADGSTVERLVYSGGPGDVTTELLRISGGGHSWPGAAISPPGTNYDIDASEEIWNFFSKYDINGRVEGN